MKIKNIGIEILVEAKADKKILIKQKEDLVAGWSNYMIDTKEDIRRLEGDITQIDKDIEKLEKGD